MAKINVVLEVDDVLVKKESDQYALEDAISRELGWLANSGLYVESWKFREEKSNTFEKEFFDVICHRKAVLIEIEEIKGHEVGYYSCDNELYFALRDNGNVTNYKNNLDEVKVIVREVWGKDEVPIQQTVEAKVNEQLDLESEYIISNAVEELSRAQNMLEEYCQYETDAINPEDELLEDIKVSIDRLGDLLYAIKNTFAPQKEENTISIQTPIGDIVVTSKTDSNYPGVYVDLKGENIVDNFEVNTTSLAMIEFDSDKKKIQTVVYGDSTKEEPTITVEHGNYLKKSLSDLIATASGKTQNKPSVNKDTEIIKQ